jgi:hypothetical protein
MVKNTKTRRAGLGLESLEDRQMMACDVTLYGGAAGNTLVIRGGAYDDMVAISPIGGDLVAVDLACSSDTTRYEYYVPFITTRADLAQIVFHGYQGDDEFYNNTDVSTLLYGHAGNDTLYGGGGRDAIYGGTGIDELHAGYWGPGGDSLYGGDGNDRLYGSVGGDYLYGDNGDDRLVGLSGNDGLYGGYGVDRLEGGDDNDYLDGGYDGVTDYLHGDAGHDTFAIHQTYRSSAWYGYSFTWWEQDPDWCYDSDSTYSYAYRYHGEPVSLYYRDSGYTW